LLNIESSKKGSKPASEELDPETIALAEKLISVTSSWKEM